MVDTILLLFWLDIQFLEIIVEALSSPNYITHFDQDLESSLTDFKKSKIL